ncbi:MAG: hypothetical protein ABIL37_01295 [candidate division WOR-3 bacterium]
MVIFYVIITLFVGSILYVVLFKPFEDILTVTQPLWNGTEVGINAMTQLHSLWLWFPIILFILLVVYLLIRAQEEKTYGYVYP